MFGKRVPSAMVAGHCREVGKLSEKGAGPLETVGTPSLFPSVVVKGYTRDVVLREFTTVVDLRALFSCVYNEIYRDRSVSHI